MKFLTKLSTAVLFAMSLHFTANASRLAPHHNSLSPSISSSRLQLTDDASWVNAGISDALKAGLTEYVLPNRTLVVSSPIIIPAGASNFTLRGDPDGQTLITNPDCSLSSAIVVGDNITLNNNWGITNRVNYLANDAAEGSTTLKLKTNGAIKVYGTYVIWDPATLHPINDSRAAVMNHAELVRVSAYDPATYTVTFSRPLGRAYGGGVSLAYVNDFVCRNIAVKDISFDGSGNGVAASGGLLCAQLCDGFTASNLSVQNFSGWAITVQSCINTVVKNCTVLNATDQTPGHGYAMTASRCRSSAFQDCVAGNVRHGFVAHGGATDVSFVRCLSNGGNFDTHGMDERRINYLDCTTDQGFALGNEVWPAGVYSVNLTNCKMARELRLNAGSKLVTVSNSQLGFIIVNSLTGGGGAWTNGVTISDSVLSFTDTLLRETEFIGGIYFKRCRLFTTRPEWGNVFAFRNLQATITFDTCDFISGSTRSFDSMITVLTPKPGFKLVVQNCRFYSDYGVDVAISLAQGSAGQYVFTNNIFKSLVPSKAVFLSNFGSGTVTSTGNLGMCVSSPPSGVVLKP